MKVLLRNEALVSAVVAATILIDGSIGVFAAWDHPTRAALVASTMATLIVAAVALITTWSAQRQRELTVEALLASFRPAVSLTENSSVAEERFAIKARNDGHGTAINLQCWLEKPGEVNESREQRRFVPALPREGEKTWDWPATASEVPDFKGKGGSVIAQYADVHGRVFESRLEYTTTAPASLVLGSAKTDRRL